MDDHHHPALITGVAPDPLLSTDQSNELNTSDLLTDFSSQLRDDLQPINRILSHHALSSDRTR